MRSFWRDENARVPFAVIGIFLILISTVVSINLNRLDVKMAKTMSSNIDITAPDNAIQYAKADLARAINYAGMKALKKIGETPVLGPIEGTDRPYGPYGDANTDPNEVNKNWAKGMINYYLQLYIESNFMYDSFVYNGYSVNVEIGDPKDIQIIPVKMKLKDKLLDHSETEYETYWKVSVPLKVFLNDLKKKSKPIPEEIVVETIITSRLPLLKGLTEEYEHRLNSNMKSEIFYLQLLNTNVRGNLGINNIVDNKQLNWMVNMFSLANQAYVFNSADPIGILKFMSGGEKFDMNDAKSSSFEIKPQDHIFDSIGDDAKEKYESQEKKIMIKPILDFVKNELKKNITKISKGVYSGSLKTSISRVTGPIIFGPKPDGYEDAGAGNWQKGTPEKISSIDRDLTKKPIILFGEVWKIVSTREHKFKKLVEKPRPCAPEEDGPCFDTVYEYYPYPVYDSQTDSVTFKVLSEKYAAYKLTLHYSDKPLDTYNDIDDAFLEKSTDDGNIDSNLKKITDDYTTACFNKDTNSNIVLGSSAPPCYDNFFMEDVSDSWLEEEASSAIDEIYKSMNDEIIQDPSINNINFPYPPTFILKVKENLFNKIITNEWRYINEDKYEKNGVYNSASDKVILLVRKWYVDEVKYQLNTQLEASIKNITDNIKDKKDKNELKDTETDGEGSDLPLGGMNIPVGATMKAYLSDGYHEDVTLSVNQEPDYFDAYQQQGIEEKTYRLNLRNIAVFGPTGIPILPPPFTWIWTTNLWTIEVDGNFEIFTVQDIDDETIPDPIFGHTGQVYIRTDEKVVDINGKQIGNNKKIEFKFDTWSPLIVFQPKPAGDKEVIERTPGI